MCTRCTTASGVALVARGLPCTTKLTASRMVPAYSIPSGVPIVHENSAKRSTGMFVSHTDLLSAAANDSSSWSAFAGRRLARASHQARTHAARARADLGRARGVRPAQADRSPERRSGRAHDPRSPGSPDRASSARPGPGALSRSSAGGSRLILAVVLNSCLPGCDVGDLRTWCGFRGRRADGRVARPLLRGPAAREISAGRAEARS